MTQTPAIPQTSQQKKQLAIDAFNGLNPQERKDAAQQLQQQGALPHPGPSAIDSIWVIIVVSFAIVLVGGATALTLAVFFKGNGALSGDLLLTIFTTAGAFLAGLLAPSPNQPKPPQP